MQTENLLYIVVPCYNEQAVLPETNDTLMRCLPRIPMRTRILYVDDGSHDGTWPVIQSLSRIHPEVEGLRLARNSGQQTATWAGMEYCVKDADALICIDADLQDDIEVLVRMAEDFLSGFDVVYGVRSDRSSDSPLKRYPAWLFYRMMRWLGCELVEDHSEFRLLSRRAASALLSFPERNLFVRCMVPLVGFPSTREYYSRQPRKAGETKYSPLKLAALALDGVTSFSVRPIRWIQLLGCLSILVSFGVIAWAMANYALGRTSQGWPSLLISLWFLSGVLLLAMGIIGEYVGKIYTEAKRRPRYFVRETTCDGQREVGNYC